MINESLQQFLLSTNMIQYTNLEKTSQPVAIQKHFISPPVPIKTNKPQGLTVKTSIFCWMVILHFTELQSSLKRVSEESMTTHSPTCGKNKACTFGNWFGFWNHWHFIHYYPLFSLRRQTIFLLCNLKVSFLHCEF